MPVLNAGGTIGDALDSAALLGGTIETIVVDGGSTDATLAVAARYNFARVIPAPGSSIYEALNLAIARARAPVVAWLNADDRFVAAGVAAARAILAADPEVEIVRGRPEFLRGDGAGGWSERERRIEARTAGPLSLPLITRGPLAINSMLFRRSLIQRVGPFDTTLRLAADREWMLRAWRAGARIAELDAPLYRYRVHPGSSTLDLGMRNHRRARDEHRAILRRLLPPALGLAAGDPARAELRRWHAVESALTLQLLLRGRAWREAAKRFMESGRLDPGWPLVLAAQLPGMARARRRDRAT
jgi:glycosyltransferase involved in cell wall biosynthesis